MGKKTKKQKEITAINEKMTQLFNRFGSDNSTYQAMVSYIEASGFDYHYTANGVISISQGKSNPITQGDINKLQRYKTYGQLKSTARRKLIESGIDKPTQDEIEESVKVYSMLHDFISEHREEIYANKTMHDLVTSSQGNMSYNDAIKLIKEIAKPVNINEYIDVFANERIIR